jgi:hypothetical protein
MYTRLTLLTQVLLVVPWASAQIPKYLLGRQIDISAATVGEAYCGPGGDGYVCGTIAFPCPFTAISTQCLDTEHATAAPFTPTGSSSGSYIPFATIESLSKKAEVLSSCTICCLRY